MSRPVLFLLFSFLFACSGVKAKDDVYVVVAGVSGYREITAKELFRYVSRKVGEKTDGKQHPVMWGKFNDDAVLFDWNRR